MYNSTALFPLVGYNNRVMSHQSAALKTLRGGVTYTIMSHMSSTTEFWSLLLWCIFDHCYTQHNTLSGSGIFQTLISQKIVMLEKAMERFDTVKRAQRNADTSQPSTKSEMTSVCFYSEWLRILFNLILIYYIFILFMTVTWVATTIIISFKASKKVWEPLH